MVNRNNHLPNDYFNELFNPFYRSIILLITIIKRWWITALRVIVSGWIGAAEQISIILLPYISIECWIEFLEEDSLGDVLIIYLSILMVFFGLTNSFISIKG